MAATRIGHQERRSKCTKIFAQNVGRLYFAGEATSAEYFGFLQGAWFEGQAVGTLIADCLTKGTNCTGEVNYPVLLGVTPTSEYNTANGWEVTSFQTNGF